MVFFIVTILLLMRHFPWDQLFSFTLYDGIKLLITAALILFVTKIQLFSDKLSALLIALPLTSLVAMVWMHWEKQSSERIANHAEFTFWYVIPTLPMFLTLPFCLRQGMNFWLAIGLNCLLTAVLFWGFVFFLKKFNIQLL